MVSKMEERRVKEERSWFYHLSLLTGSCLGFRDISDGAVKFTLRSRNWAKRLLFSVWTSKISLRCRLLSSFGRDLSVHVDLLMGMEGQRKAQRRAQHRARSWQQ